MELARTNALDPGGAGAPPSTLDRITAALMLALPAALLTIGLLLWPAPSNTAANACSGPTAAQTRWIHVAGATTSISALLFAALISARPQKRGRVPWAVMLVGGLLAVIWVAHGYVLLLPYISLAPGVVGAVFVLIAARSGVPRVRSLER